MTQDALARLLAENERWRTQEGDRMPVECTIVAALVRVAIATRAFLDCDSTEESDERGDEIDAALVALDAALAKGAP